MYDIQCLSDGTPAQYMERAEMVLSSNAIVFLTSSPHSRVSDDADIEKPAVLLVITRLYTAV